MKSMKMTRVLSFALATALGVGAFAAIAGCTPKNESLIIMTQELNGLFNPFYSTAGTDMDVVGQTQISMFSTDSEGNIAYGDKEAVVVKDYTSEYHQDTDTTDYTFVIKNGLKFSDGEPLTMNDILFNIYVYLDPAYTGSTTMYSTKVVGLQDYRTQQVGVVGDDTNLNKTVMGRVSNRILELQNLFQETGRTSPTSESYYAKPETIREAIKTWPISDGYKLAISPAGTDGKPTISDADARAQLLADYNHVVGDPAAAANSDEAKGLFRMELENDYKAAKDAYQEPPYTNKDTNKNGKIDEDEKTNHTDVKFDEVTSFMFYEGYYEVEYGKKYVNGKQIDDPNNIQKLTPTYNNSVKDQKTAIDYIYNSYVPSKFDQIINSWAGTAATLESEFTAEATDVVLHENLGGKTGLLVESISGVRSLGHKLRKVDPSSGAVTYEEWPEDAVTIKGNSYAIAKEHNEDGTPKNANTYDVLQITIEGTDPKAIWNFGFSVAPYHYYSDPTKESLKVDIEENKFGVEWASFDFHTKVIQGKTAAGVSKNKVPLGAGPYVATNRKNEDNPSASSFIENDMLVFYKANENFFKDVPDAADTLHPPYIKKMCYQVFSQANALDGLAQGAVHFVEPQFTKENDERLTKDLSKKGMKALNTWQLGYGYIGVNARYVKNIYLRKAIMSAMDISRSLGYYVDGSADTINWPMSLVSWAYPRTGAADPNNPKANKDINNGKDYATFTTDAAAIEKIEKYMKEAENNGGYNDSDLHVRFTIAGSNLTEHPCYAVFLHAEELLESCGWQIDINPDTYALTKLSTGSLAVWAAAWGSTIDPDMYQVYHKDSTATSVLAWGYKQILADEGTYVKENEILPLLSQKIEEGRTTEDRTKRTAIYKDAMSMVLDLAVELPVYQRQTLYVYNSKVIDESTFRHDESGNIINNPYSSPLAYIWELKLK